MRISRNFFLRDVLEVAPDLLGKYVVRRLPSGETLACQIVEVEAYRGEEDLACHASKGRTARTEVMYHRGGVVYVYLIYGMYQMLNFVTGTVDNPQAVLIRGVEGASGPGKVGRLLQIDKSFYGEDLCASPRLWVEDRRTPLPAFTTTPRIGIGYAREWREKKWRFLVENCL
jgi:DNA-3-methyladenine glycosylase